MSGKKVKQIRRMVARYQHDIELSVMRKLIGEVRKMNFRKRLAYCITMTWGILFIKDKREE